MVENQWKEDKKLVERIDKFGRNLPPKDTAFIESCLKWLERGPLTEPMRKWAEDIDARSIDA